MTEPLGAGNSREYDILGIKMFDSAELRVHMTGKAILAHGRQVAGPGSRDHVGPDRGPRARVFLPRTSWSKRATPTRPPFGMGTYASRSTPVAGAAVSMVSRKIRAKARKIAAHLLEGVR